MRNTSIRIAPWVLGLCAVSASASPTAAAAVEAPPPGVYGQLLIGYAPAKGQVTGYFHDETGGGQFSCILYVEGAASGRSTRITTYFPPEPKARIDGVLTLAGGQITIALNEEPGGCGMVNPFADKDRPATFDLNEGRPWMQIRVVRTKKAYFYNAPDDAVHRKGYMVQGDGVGVRDEKPGWLNVDYPNPDKMISGWVREADLYPGP